MRKTICKGIKTFAVCLFAAALFHSCQEEKPVFDLEDKTFSFETTQDTLSVTEDDKVTVTFSTSQVPWVLTEELDIDVTLTDTAGVNYKYARITSIEEVDGFWTLKVDLLKGYKNGDVVTVTVSAPGKKYISQDVVLFVPELGMSMRINLKDEFVINEGGTAQILIRTRPYTLVGSDSVSLFFVDTLGTSYPVNMTKPVMQKDSTWMINVGLRYPEKTGDVIRLALQDTESDTVMYSDRLVVKIIPAEEPLYKELHRVSGDVSAFEDGGMATVRFRTVPWNLLLNAGQDVNIAIMDTACTSSEKFLTGACEFQPDSTWTIQVSFANGSTKKDEGVVAVTTPTYSLKSEKFTVEKVSLVIDRIRLLNYIYGPDDDISRMYYDVNTKTFSAVLPATTNFKGQRLRISHNGDRLTVGDSAIEARTTKYNTLDLTQPITISVWKYDLHKDYTVVMNNTNLPIVRITTPKDLDGNRKPIKSKTQWLEKCSIEIVYPDGRVQYQDDSLSIRGRGNGTWTETDKKPYALKLNHKHKILGMKKHKRWILLANYKDYTLMRNDAAFWLSRQTNLPYTVSGRFVELVINGEHRGNYYLCEAPKIDNDRINIDAPNLADPASGGFFMEIDTYYNYDGNKDPGFYSQYYNLPYMFKDPDELEDESVITSGHPAFQYLQGKINEMEKSLSDRQQFYERKYRDYIDVNTAIDFALIQEMTMNHDSYNTWPSNGPHSTYLYMDQTHTGGKFCFGPVWDFDYHTFMPTCYENGVDLTKNWAMLKTGAKTGSGRYYFETMLQDPEFRDSLIARWNVLKVKFAELPQYIELMADSIRESERFNRILWFDKTSNTQNNDRGSFDYAISRMIQGFWARYDWLDENINGLR